MRPAEILSVHEPLLVNLLGHAAGAIVFGIFLALVLRQPAAPRLQYRNLAIFAASLALFWNLGSLLVLWAPASSALSEATITLSFAALSLLPAVLLHLSAGLRLRGLVLAGYAVSAVAIGLHASEPLLNATSIHRTALIIAAAGFAGLTLTSAFLLLRAGKPRPRSLAPRLVGTMALALLAISFAHLHSGGAHSAWPLELLLHHASIPLALFVLLQDYRFVLLDAFVRFLANILLAGAFTMLAARTAAGFGWIDLTGSPRRLALAFFFVSCLLILYALARTAAQTLLTALVFRRPNLGAQLELLRRGTPSAAPPNGYLEWAAARIAAFFGAAHHSLLPEGAADLLAEVTRPIRVGPLETRILSLGRRAGGRRYLSEDLDALSSQLRAVEEYLDRARDAELRHLVSRAELRALQAQIHPHFLFNALNTLYGIIPRTAEGARRMVLNLSDVFRYFLRNDKTFLPLDEELAVIRAYLEIESLRLGPKLHIQLDIDPQARSIRIPALSLQPLVENAVKHGIANSPAGGTLSIAARMQEELLHLTVSDTGPGFHPEPPSPEHEGVGLENVRRRLRLCYGPDTRLSIESIPGATRVGFSVPVHVEALRP